MNTYQAGALNDTIKKEFSAREKWMRGNMDLLERTGQLSKFQKMLSQKGESINLGHYDEEEESGGAKRPASRPASAAPRVTGPRPTSAAQYQPQLNGSFSASFVPDAYDPEVTVVVLDCHKLWCQRVRVVVL
jgi:hypothetical protein